MKAATEERRNVGKAKMRNASSQRKRFNGTVHGIPGRWGRKVICRSRWSAKRKGGEGLKNLQALLSAS